MNIEAITQIVQRICVILSAHGQPDRVPWFQERLTVLERTDAVDAECRLAFQQLHGVVLGMGGLIDLPLYPSESVDDMSAHLELNRLAEQLYDMTSS